MTNQTRNILKDQVILGLIMSAFTIVISLILAEVQTKIGLDIMLLSLVLVLAVFAIVIRLIQIPLQRLLVKLVNDLKRPFEQQSITWLLDTDQLIEYELKTDSPEIWLLTSDLLDDSQGGPFQIVVANNLKRNVKQVYFVPDIPEIQARIETMFAHHGNSKLLNVVYLPDNFFFLVPKLDIVIYDPLSKGVAPKAAFMGIPAPGEMKHYHAAVSLDFIDKLVGTLLEPYKEQVLGNNGRGRG